jgi:hypothetical protein
VQNQQIINSFYALQGRNAQIQSDELALRQRIHEMETWHLTRLERADLADLKRQLAALEREEKQVTQQMKELQKAQH